MKEEVDPSFFGCTTSYAEESTAKFAATLRHSWKFVKTSNRAVECSYCKSTAVRSFTSVAMAEVLDFKPSEALEFKRLQRELEECQ